jgi:hypothetical protein
MRERLDAQGRIDLTNVDNLSDKVVNEQDSRRKWLMRARAEGYEKDMLLLFSKYDRLIRLATEPKERADIAKLGVLEVYKLMGSGGELYVDGELVSKG